VLEWTGKDIKAVIITVFSMFKKVETGKVKKETQIKLLEMKTDM